MHDYLETRIRAALAALAYGRDDLPDDFDPDAVAVEFQTPNNPEHGDLATNLACPRAPMPASSSPRSTG